MGYNTDFNGRLEFSRKLNKVEKDFFDFLYEKRHEDNSVYPSLYCQWTILEKNDKDYLLWDGGEKFYEYKEWLDYIILNMSKDLLLNGCLHYRGDDFYDFGSLLVVNNVLVHMKGIFHQCQ